MIKEFEFYHGVVFAKLVHESNQCISIQSYPSNSNASYILNGKIGLYIKHSTKRLTPWRFSFNKEHQDEIFNMKNNLEQVFLILVCNEDGIVTLNYAELKLLLDDNHNNIEWISASRGRNKEYSVNGSDGGLSRKVGKSDFIRKIFHINIPTITNIL